MKYLEFLKKFKNYPLITYQDIKNVFNSVNHVQLINWQKKTLLLKLKRGIFVLPDTAPDPHIIANGLNPSYISLEYALSYYQLIPDIARVITSVSKNRPEKINNFLGNFHYKKISPRLYTGFTAIESAMPGLNFRIATPEKALFDLVYFRSDLKETKDFQSLRLNIDKKFNFPTIEEYSKLIKSRSIKYRIFNLLKYLKKYDLS